MITRQREDKELSIKTYLHKREKKNWNRNFENKGVPKFTQESTIFIIKNCKFFIGS